jgi:hypothetical protein
MNFSINLSRLETSNLIKILKVEDGNRVEDMN